MGYKKYDPCKAVNLSFDKISTIKKQYSGWDEGAKSA